MKKWLLVSSFALGMLQYGCGGGGDQSTAVPENAVGDSSSKTVFLQAAPAVANQSPLPVLDSQQELTPQESYYVAFDFGTKVLTNSGVSLEDIRLGNADKDFEAFLYMLGGAEGYETLRSSLSPEEWLAVHRIAGMSPKEPSETLLHEGKFHLYPHDQNVENQNSSLESDGTGCPQYFSSEDWGESFLFDSNKVTLDVVGRPYISFVISDKPLPTAQRQDYCQRKIGTWGLPDDVGGHLVASSLGGWGGRANIVPQNGVLNNSEWKRIENQVRRCMVAGYITQFTPRAIPPLRSRSLRPDRFLTTISIGEPYFIGPIKFYRTVALAQLQVRNEVPDAATIANVDKFVADFSAYCG
jgi:YHS domain-containing protein